MWPSIASLPLPGAEYRWLTDHSLEVCRRHGGRSDIPRESNCDESMITLSVAPLSDGFTYGARVRGLKAPDVQDDCVRQQLRAVFQDRGLIVFEDVEPTNRMQLAISGVFGSIKTYPAPLESSTGAKDRGVAEMATKPETCTVVEIDRERLANWMPWHFDQCYNARPNRARVLRCSSAPPVGGLTGFLDGVELYKSISSGTREQIEGSISHLYDGHES